MMIFFSICTFKNILYFIFRKDESIKQPNYLNYGDSQPKDLVLKKRELGTNISYKVFIQRISMYGTGNSNT